MRTQQVIVVLDKCNEKATLTDGIVLWRGYKWPIHRFTFYAQLTEKVNADIIIPSETANMHSTTTVGQPLANTARPYRGGDIFGEMRDAQRRADRERDGLPSDYELSQL